MNEGNEWRDEGMKEEWVKEMNEGNEWRNEINGWMEEWRNE